MSEENFIFVFVIVPFLIYLAYELYNYVRYDLKTEKDKYDEDVVDDFFEKLDVYVENTGYNIGMWDKEIRKELKSISDIKTKYKPNKELNVLIGDYIGYSISNTVSVLESMGIKTTMAKSGLEVIKRIKDGEKYDLIITNNIYDRGHCDGPQTLNRLKEIENFNIPVIILTISENERERYIHQCGFDEYMTKILNQEKVLETLPKVIKNLKFTKIRTKKSNKS